jgi:hypothetical protein
MKLTLQWLKDNNACKEGIDFAIRNKLIGFPFDMLPFIKGDYGSFYVCWVEENKNNIIHHYYVNGLPCVMTTQNYHPTRWYFYDANDNLILEKDSDGYECKHEYDNHNNQVYSQSDDGSFTIREFDSNNNLIYKKESSGFEVWYDYDANNVLKFQKEKVDNTIAEALFFHDDHNNVIQVKRSTGFNFCYTTEYYPDGQLKQYSNGFYIPFFEKV